MSAVRVIAITVLSAVLCGCAAIEKARQEGQRRDLQDARQRYATIGFADGTPLFAHCVEAELIRIGDQRQRALEQVEQQGPRLPAAFSADEAPMPTDSCGSRCNKLLGVLLTVAHPV